MPPRNPEVLKETTTQHYVKLRDKALQIQIIMLQAPKKHVFVFKTLIGVWKNAIVALDQ
jgi:hypothetical protein